MNNNKKIKEKSVLYSAVEKENVEIIDLLLTKEKLDVNIPYLKNKDNELEVKSPLYLAFEKENVEIIELLLANKDLNINYINISMIVYICKI